ncbi:MAG: phosphatase PAP2 family protein [Eubacteriales bacterium]|nr:phosphatase PAP2 family protein [Eubacteriales bacterium]
MSFPDFEIGILKAIQSIKCPFLDFIMPKISFLGNSGWIWIAAAAALLCFKKTRKHGITLAFGLIICLLLNNLTLKPLIARDRPFIYDPTIKLIINAPKEYSFPSGHTLSAFMAATVLWHCDKRRFGYAAFIIASLIGFSRLYLQVHYLTDVLGGAVIGVLFGIAAIIIIDIIYKKNFCKEKNDNGTDAR